MPAEVLLHLSIERERGHPQPAAPEIRREQLSDRTILELHNDTRPLRPKRPPSARPDPHDPQDVARARRLAGRSPRVLAGSSPRLLAGTSPRLLAGRRREVQLHGPS